MSFTDRQIVLSGVRATGELHIGNYLGAIQFFVELARDPANHCLFFIANLHSLTTRQDPEAMVREMRDIVRWYLAAGIDPKESIIFAQSSVPETAELSWLLSCLTADSELRVMPHWEEKSEGKGQKANAGLLTYPVLMAADILGPGANIVPVGEDQHPHVELARKLARRFNGRFGEEVFPVPELLDQAVRIPGLKGAGKMGKSEPRGTINLGEPPKRLRKKCMGADKKLPEHPVNNPDPDEPRIGEDPGNPLICRVHQLHTYVSSPTDLTLVRNGCSTAALRCGDCKGMLAESLTQMLEPMQARYAEVLERGDGYIDDLLHDGGLRARAMIKPRVDRAKALMGVRSF